MDTISKNIYSSFIWKVLERFGSQISQFIVQIVLARILLPSDFGVIVIASIFILFANIFVQSGFTTALIQRRDVITKDYSTAFYTSLSIAMILYVFIFLISPIAARFYENLQLTLILRLLSLKLFTGVFYSIQNAYISKNFKFRKLFIATIIGTLFSGMTGVIFAINGFGAYSLVIQQLVEQLIIILILYYILDCKLTFEFSKRSLFEMFSYSYKLILAGFLGFMERNLRLLIIGKYYDESTLSYYNRGFQFPSFIITSINASIQSITLPLFSMYQDKNEILKKQTKDLLDLGTFIVFPIAAGLYILAEPIVLILLTEKWLGAAIYMKIFALMFAMYPIHTINIQLIAAKGDSSKILKIEILKTLLSILVIIITINFGIMAIAIGATLSGIISWGINSYFTGKLISYTFINQFFDLKKNIFINIVMIILGTVIVNLFNSMYSKVFFTMLICIFFYFVCTLIFNKRIVKEFQSILNELKLRYRMRK